MGRRCYRLALLNATCRRPMRWATWCEPCLEEMPYLAALDDRPDLPLKVIGVNMREDPELVRAYLAELDSR